MDLGPRQLIDVLRERYLKQESLMQPQDIFPVGEFAAALKVLENEVNMSGSVPMHVS